MLPVFKTQSQEVTRWNPKKAITVKYLPFTANFSDCCFYLQKKHTLFVAFCHEAL